MEVSLTSSAEVQSDVANILLAAWGLDIQSLPSVTGTKYDLL